MNAIAKPAESGSEYSHALALAARGFFVFPLVRGTKRPLIDKWPHLATRDTEQIRKWWLDPVMGFEMGHGIGISAGRFGGDDAALLVIDVDVKGGKQGDKSLRALEDEHGALPSTYTQTTPSGGRHLVYRVPQAVKNSASAIGEGLDVRSAGGFIVGAGSTLSTGTYTGDDSPIVDAPGWLVDLCGKPAERAERKPAAPVVPIDAKRVKARAMEYLSSAPVAVEGSGGDQTTYNVACKVKDYGIGEDECLTLMLAYWNDRCQPPWNLDDLATKVKNAYRYGHDAPGSAAPEAQFAPVAPDAPDAGAERAPVTLSVEPGLLHELATKAERALIEAGTPFYIRGPRIVRPVVENVDASRGRKTKAARLAEVGGDTLIDYMSRVAQWLKFDTRRKQPVRVKPPRDVAQILLSRDGEWTFPRLTCVLTTPTLRPDGSLLQEAGYDASTRILLVDPPALPPIPAKPSKADAEKALALLNGLIAECPFVDEASRSVALSALITPVVRGALPVVPLHVSRAPAAGSSKSFLMDVAAMIATGDICPVISAGANEAETEKRLGAAVIAGQPIVSIDNVNGELGGDALCQLIERPLVDVRPLGRSELVRVESRATIFATGNNIQVVGDMVRRTLLCSLDANLERPELRQFNQDPLALIAADRGQYIAAALTVVLAYIAAGCPGELPTLASFGEWSRYVRSALAWLGCDDPVLSMETARAEDPETEALNQIVTAWAEVVGVNTPLTAGEIIEAATGMRPCAEGGTLPDCTPLASALDIIAADRGRVDAKRLAKWLSRYKGRIANGVKIVGQRDPKAKQIKWRLTPLAGIAGIGGYSPNPSREKWQMTKIDKGNETIPANTRQHPPTATDGDSARGKRGRIARLFS